VCLQRTLCSPRVQVSLRVIMLSNNIKILLVSFVHHIELQNFLNAPRIRRHVHKLLTPVVHCCLQSSQNCNIQLDVSTGAEQILLISEK